MVKSVDRSVEVLKWDELNNIQDSCNEVRKLTKGVLLDVCDEVIQGIIESHLNRDAKLSRMHSMIIRLRTTLDSQLLFIRNIEMSVKNLERGKKR